MCSKVIISIARDIQLVLADSENLLEEQRALLDSIENGLSKADKNTLLRERTSHVTLLREHRSTRKR